MRIRHSLKSLIPVILMLASARNVQAQGGPPMPGMAGPGMPMAGAPQVPGSYGMYPSQSPYQAMFEQTYQRDGTWFQNSVNGFGPANKPRDWFMNLDYTRTRTRKMDGLIGADGVQTYFQQNDPDSNGINDGLSFYRYFDAASASIIPSLATNGIRLSGGFWNTDGSGFLYSVGYQFENTSTFDAREKELSDRLDTATALQFQRDEGRIGYQPFYLGGRTDLDILRNDILAPGVVFDTADSVSYGPFGTTFDVLDRTLLNLYGLPTTNGNFPSVLNGQTSPYDLDFIVSQTINAGGANAAWAFSPVYDNDNIKVRPIFGGRYFRIDEQFRFDGASTLLSYTDDGDADTPDNAKVFLPGTGITPDTPTDRTYTAPDDATSLIVYSFIHSQVVSNLSGPELGFHYELGRAKGIQVTGSTRVAAMFNNEKLRLSGDNIGNFMGTELATPDPITGATTETNMFNTDTTQGPSLNAFSDSASNTHLSPLFEQSLNAQIPIFDRVPVLRDMWQLEDAKLSLGWTFLLIGQVADPNDSIVYDSSPTTGDFLHYSIERNAFFQNTVNVGINWTY
jgi:hypothetical protein